MEESIARLVVHFYLEEAKRSDIMFDLTKDEYEYLKDKLMLNEELSRILEMKIKRYSITQMSMELNISERTVNRRIKDLKKKITRVL